MLVDTLKHFQKRLTNLTASNRSIFIGKLSDYQELSFSIFDNIDPKVSAHTWLEELIFKQKTIKNIPYLHPKDDFINELSLKLNKIYKSYKQIEIESGAKPLYIGYPIVTGKFNENVPVRTPLIFFPIELDITYTNQKPHWQIKINKDIQPFFNKSFLLAYQHYTTTKIEEYWLEYSFEWDDIKDILSFKNKLYGLLKETPFTVDFNKELYTQHLHELKSLKSADFISQSHIQLLQLQPQAVLGIFNQSDSKLYQDFEHWIANASEEEVDFEHFFSQKKVEHKKAKEEDIIAPFDIDESQEAALQALHNGKSIIIQGPPGTGKSQLICNIASGMAARGKKVLIVSQKKVALDVVYNRLKEKNLHHFAALVHDAKQDRKTLFKAIENQITNVDSYMRDNASLNTISLEREFLQTCRETQLTVDQLENFKKALFDTSLFGISVKELYLISNANYKNDSITEWANKIDYLTLQENINKIKQLFQYQSLIKDVNRKNWGEFTLSHADTIYGLIQQMAKLLYQLPSSVIWSKEKINTLLFQKDILHTLAKSPKLLFYTNGILNDISKNSIDKSTLLTAQAKHNQYWSIDINKKSWIEALAKKLELAYPYTSNIFKQKYYVLWKDKEIQLLHTLDSLKIKFDKKHISILKNQCSDALTLHQTLEKYTVTWGKELTISEFAREIEFLLNAITLIENNPEIYSFIACVEMWQGQEIDTKIKMLESIIALLEQSNRYFNENSLLQNIAHYLQLSKQDISALIQYDTLRKDTNSYCVKIFDQLKNIADHETWIHFIYNKWIDIIEQKHPELSLVAGFRIYQQSRLLQDLIKRKASLSLDIINLKLKENTYKGLIYNRLNNRVTYRDLLHQVSKQKKIWSIGKVVQEFADELYHLIPIWLVSPETAATIFPMQECFDLVIFDEASQCFVEKGITVAYRGKQIAIAGDSKQLQPFDLYMPRWQDEDEEENIDLQIDSLLSFGERYLPSYSLTHHYRSQYFDLINFSNQHFYNNSLQMIPFKTQFQDEKKSLEYRLVQGVWHQNCNQAEADYVVQFLINYPIQKHKIGVVTFNAKQQQLIIQKIANHQILLQKNIPNEYFVKNIENVQGDECDILIFSLAYAPDKTGKMYMNFGVLNQLHGENRLNVAITRAREKLIVVASILPSQLQTDQAMNQGPKLLKLFLEYVYSKSNSEIPTKLHSTQNYTPTENTLRAKLKAKSKNLQFCPPYMGDLIDEEDKIILTDDDRLYMSNSKAFFGYHPLNLSNKNWTYTLNFSRNFWENLNI